MPDHARRPDRPWFRLMCERCAEWKGWLAGDPRRAPAAIPELARVCEDLPGAVLLFEKAAG